MLNSSILILIEMLNSANTLITYIEYSSVNFWGV